MSRKKHAYRWENPKYRDNWPTSCIRFDCVNRNVLCNSCRRFSFYKLKPDGEVRETEKTEEKAQKA